MNYDDARAEADDRAALAESQEALDTETRLRKAYGREIDELRASLEECRKAINPEPLCCVLAGMVDILELQEASQGDGGQARALRACISLLSDGIDGSRAALAKIGETP